MIADWNGNKSTKKILTKDLFFEEAYKFFGVDSNIVIKGASLLNNILKEENNLIIRSTKDVDFSMQSYTKDEIKDKCYDFLKILQEKYEISDLEFEEDEKTQNSNIYLTMNFYDRKLSVIAKTKRQIRDSIKYNLDFITQPKYKPYLYNFYDTDIQGSDVNKIFADKVINISTRKVFSRTKDLVDLFSLSFSTKYEIEIFRILDYMKTKDDIEMGDFDYFLNNRDNVLKAIAGLRGVTYYGTMDTLKEMDIEYIYGRTLDFISPFLNISDIRANAIWNPQKGIWMECEGR